MCTHAFLEHLSNRRGRDTERDESERGGGTSGATGSNGWFYIPGNSKARGLHVEGGVLRQIGGGGTQVTLKVPFQHDVRPYLLFHWHFALVGVVPVAAATKSNFILFLSQTIYFKCRAYTNHPVYIILLIRSNFGNWKKRGGSMHFIGLLLNTQYPWALEISRVINI